MGNILSLFLIIKTYRSKRKENRNLLFCLSIVCASDLSILIFGCFREYLEEVYGYHLRSANIYSCKILYFTVYFFSSFSSYTYAFISLYVFCFIVNSKQLKIFIHFLNFFKETVGTRLQIHSHIISVDGKRIDDSFWACSFIVF